MGYSSRGAEAQGIFKWHVTNSRATYSPNYVALDGTWTIVSHVASHGGQLLSNETTHQLNDEVALGGFYVPTAAAYTAYMILSTGSDSGEIHININGTDTGTIDGYAASGASNVIKSVSLGTLTVGAKSVSIDVADKNASSSNYYANIQALFIAED